MLNYQYLTPPARVSKSPRVRQVSPNGQRLIFGGSDLQLSNEQIQAVHRLKQYLKHKNPGKNYDNSLLLRFCLLGQLRTTDAIEKLKLYEEWDSMPGVARDRERAILNSGVFYCYGRDLSYHPNLYFNPSKIDLANYSLGEYLVSVRTLLGPVQSAMLVPGRLEKWNIIVEARSLNEDSLRKNQSVVLTSLAKIMNAYPYRMNKIFLIYLNPKSMMSRFRGPSTSLCEQAIAQLHLQPYCVRVDNLSQLDPYISADEREANYGGALDNLYEFWPITSTNRLMEVNSRFIEGSEDSVDYNSINNDENAQFFEELDPKEGMCNLKDGCCLQ